MFYIIWSTLMRNYLTFLLLILLLSPSSMLAGQNQSREANKAKKSDSIKNMLRIKIPVTIPPIPIFYDDVILFIKDDASFGIGVGRGLPNDRNIAKLLENGKFIVLLQYLWAEPSQKRRVAWLYKKAYEGYPIFMFEYSKELLAEDPYESLVWFHMGVLRFEQDYHCFIDESFSKGLVSLFHDRYIGAPINLNKDLGAMAEVDALQRLKKWHQYLTPKWLLAYAGYDKLLKHENTWNTVRNTTLERRAEFRCEQWGDVRFDWLVSKIPSQI